ncbi:hypothetical protein [Pedococcus cremeus]|uniref:hypothetical protein n=1 Tax=Pedococcus cremeus TaxID=587636 RepID=UPI000B82685D|nr:hypothetical protein [Pedococcus cremeus]
MAFLAVVPLILLRLTLHGVADPDTFWHIRAGQYLWGNWKFTSPDPWSPFSSRNWILHEWLPELGLAAAASVGGLPAVAWLTVAAGALLFLFVYLSCRSWAPILPATIASTAAVFGASASLTARPQLASFVLLAVFVGAWLRTTRDGKARWWLVPLTWFWACSHGMWFVGVMVGIATIGGMILDAPRAARPRAVRLLTVPVLGMLTAAITPAGPELLLAPLRVGETTDLVSEWSAPSLTDPNVAVTLAMVGGIALIWSRQGHRIPWTRLALLASGVGWTLLYARTVALGAIIVAPLLAEALQSMHPDERVTGTRAEHWTLVGGLGVALTVAALLVPRVASEPGMPNGLDPALSRIPPGSVVFDEYSLGGWLLWRHPQLRPVIDPRVEVYDTAYVRQHVRALAAMPGWQETLRRSGARYAVVPTDSALAAALSSQEGWTESDRSDGYSLLVKG